LTEPFIWAVPVEQNQQLTYGQMHEMMHRDVSAGNNYRKERIKHLTTLATGVFVVTLTFHKDFFGGQLDEGVRGWVFAGWAFLILSLLAGIQHFRAWEDFYLEQRNITRATWSRRLADTEESSAAQQAAIKRAINDYGKAQTKIDSYKAAFHRWDLTQSNALLIGMACIAVYVVLNPSMPRGPEQTGNRSIPVPAAAGSPPPH
jgi:hypothetical protein